MLTTTEIATLHDIRDAIATREMQASPRRGQERRILARILAEYGPRMDAAFRKAVKAAMSGVVAKDLLDAIRAQNIEGAIAALGWVDRAEPVVKSDLLGTFVKAFEQSGILHMRLTSGRSSVGKQGAFSIVDDRPLAYLQRHGADLVSEFGLQNRTGLRASLTSMFERGYTPQQMQRAIIPQVGLTEPWARAVDNRLAKLVADGVPFAEAQAEAAKYADELTRLRALNIARTEPAIAHGAADYEHMVQSIEQGIADGDKATKTWNTAGDDVVRDSHAAMEGVTVRWDEQFEIEGDTVDTPPHDPNCRCWAEFRPLG